jgi:hypothetical protein
VTLASLKLAAINGASSDLFLVFFFFFFCSMENMIIFISMSRRLVLYPNGKKNSNGNGHISLYLAIANAKDLQLGWEVNANIKFFVFDQIRDKYLCIQGTFAQKLVFIVDLSLICFAICPFGNASIIYSETCYSLNSYSSLTQLILNLGLIDLMVALKKKYG